MTNTLNVDIITPDKKVLSQHATAVRLPGKKGHFGVLAGHTPFIASLNIGEIKVEADDQIFYFSTSGGFVEVFPHTVSVLAETAEFATAVDVDRAEAAKVRADKRIKEGRKSWDIDRARIALLRAINRINVARRA